MFIPFLILIGVAPINKKNDVLMELAKVPDHKLRKDAIHTTPAKVPDHKLRNHASHIQFAKLPDHSEWKLSEHVKMPDHKLWRHHSSVQLTESDVKNNATPPKIPDHKLRNHASHIQFAKLPDHSEWNLSEHVKMPDHKLWRHRSSVQLTESDVKNNATPPKILDHKLRNHASHIQFAKLPDHLEWKLSEHVKMPDHKLWRHHSSVQLTESDVKNNTQTLRAKSKAIKVDSKVPQGNKSVTKNEANVPVKKRNENKNNAGAQSDNEAIYAKVQKSLENAEAGELKKEEIERSKFLHMKRGKNVKRVPGSLLSKSLFSGEVYYRYKWRNQEIVIVEERPSILFILFSIFLVNSVICIGVYIIYDQHIFPIKSQIRITRGKLPSYVHVDNDIEELLLCHESMPGCVHAFSPFTFWCRVMDTHHTIGLTPTADIKKMLCMYYMCPIWTLLFHLPKKRAELRAESHPVLGDFLAYIFCAPCAIAQEARAVDYVTGVETSYCLNLNPIEIEEQVVGVPILLRSRTSYSSFTSMQDEDDAVQRKITSHTSKSFKSVGRKPSDSIASDDSPTGLSNVTDSPSKIKRKLRNKRFNDACLEFYKILAYSVGFILALWIAHQCQKNIITFSYGLISCIATGLSILPFIIWPDILDPKKMRYKTAEYTTDVLLGVTYSVAAGALVSAAIGLCKQARLQSHSDHYGEALVGLAMGTASVELTGRILEAFKMDPEDILSNMNLQRIDGHKILIFIVTMSLHSVAEGIALGVSFEDNFLFGKYVCITLAIHNIPRGIFVCLTLLPRGCSSFYTILLAMLATFPQTIIGVLTASGIEHVRALLPYTLAFGAGAMLYIATFEIGPEAWEQVGKNKFFTNAIISGIVMYIIQTYMLTKM